VHAGDVRRRGIGAETEPRQPVEQGVEEQGALEAGEVHTMHTWAPCPNPMCGFRSRNMSNRSGSSHLASSWLALPRLTDTIESSGIATPWNSTSRVVWRMKFSSGVSQRMPSSIACGRRPRSATSAAS
jgi:hypothetical protein